MNRLDALTALRTLDDMGRYVLRRQHLRAFFREESEKTFSESLARLVSDGLLTRAARGVYVNDAAKSKDSYTIERVAIALRPAAHNYVSLESALSEYGVISQIPMDRITVMTTGRSGEITTPYGTIEFTHTKRVPEEVRQGSVLHPGRPLRVASPHTALRDLRRVGRNMLLVDMDAFKDVIDPDEDTVVINERIDRARHKG